ncbi:MAG: amidohydrolase family protein [Hyphomicrobiales bacterium]
MSAPLLLALLAGAAFTAAPVRAQQDVPIIDVHVHLAPENGLDFRRAVQAALDLMNRYGIAHAIVMSPPRSPGIKSNQEYPDFNPTLAPHGDRFSFMAGGGSLNPAIHAIAGAAKVDAKTRADFAHTARRAVAEGAAGFGEMGSLHVSLSRDHGYTFAPADHPLMLELADIAAELDVPIDLHMDAVAAPRKLPGALAANPKNPKTLPATLDGLERLLAHNRKARIVWAHGGTDHTGDFSAKTVGEFMDRHPNLYMSLKVTGAQGQTFNKLYNGGTLDPGWSVLLNRHPDRFVIGSDSFFADPAHKGGGPLAEFSRMAERRLQATRQFMALLPPGLARRIGHENAAAIYRMRPLPALAAAPAAAKASPAPSGLCRDGNLLHCRTLCGRGVQKACAMLGGTR